MNYENEIIKTANHYDLDEAEFLDFVKNDFSYTLKILAKDFVSEKTAVKEFEKKYGCKI